MARYPGFCGPAYESQSLSVDAQKLMNWYLEKIESGDGNTDFALYPSPGTKLFVDLTQNVIVEPTFFKPPVPGGGASGNVLTLNFPSLLHDMQVGDVIFWNFTTQHTFNNALVVSITDNACAVAYTQIGPTLTNATTVSMQIFMGVVTTPIPASGALYNATITFSDSVAQANETNYMCWFRGITTLDQINGGLATSNNGPASYSGFPVNTSGANKVVLSFLGGAPSTLAVPNYKACNGNIGQFIAVHYNDFPIGIDYKSPPGSYGGTWQQQVGAGAVQVCLVNASFNIASNVIAGNIRGMLTIGVTP